MFSYPSICCNKSSDYINPSAAGRLISVSSIMKFSLGGEQLINIHKYLKEKLIDLINLGPTEIKY